MINLIIIEDEPQMCKLLSTMVDWNQLGFCLLDSFNSCSKALEYLEQHYVEAVITDISMPSMTGLDFAQICYKQFPHINMVFISAYRDFSYAQQALKWNVVAYITKPIDYNELTSAIKRLHDKIRSNGKNTFIDDEISLKRQQLVSNFMLSAVTLEDFSAQLVDLDITIDPENCIVAQLELRLQRLTEYLLEQWRYEKELLYNAISNIIMQKNHGICFIVTDYSFDTIKLMALGKDFAAKTDFQEALRTLCNQFIDNLKELLKLDAVVAIHSCSALRKLQEKIPTPEELDLKAAAITQSLLVSDKEQALKILNSLRGQYRNRQELQKNLALQVLLRLSTEFSIGYEQDINKSTDEIYDSISIIICSPHHTYDSIIKKAIDYIETHYAEDLALNDVASLVALHPNYFSAYFKQQTGEKFIDYITKVRINKAKHLLKNTNTKTTAIAYAVGYKDPQYFYRIFKNLEGITPTEYRKE